MLFCYHDRCLRDHVRDLVILDLRVHLMFTAYRFGHQRYLSRSRLLLLPLYEQGTCAEKYKLQTHNLKYPI